MEQFRVLMSRKVAGVPVGIIAVIIMGGLLYMAIRMRSNVPDDGEELTGEEQDAQDDAVAGDNFFPNDTDQPVFGATPTLYQPSGGSITATPQADTNVLWKRRSIEFLTANGETLGAATEAIQKYVNGESLSMEEGRIRDKAVKQFGLPPEDFDAGRTSNNPPVNKDTPYKGPASKQGQPPLRHTVKGKSDDTFGELARLYYGHDDNAAQVLISGSNPSLSSPLTPGQKVRIPEDRKPKWYRANSANQSLYKIAQRNGTTAGRIQQLNPETKFPVKPGTRVRVK